MDVYLENKVVSFEGDPADSYFAAIQDVANGTGALVSLASRLPADPVIFDVGANIGVTAVAMAIARPDARIFAFEPAPPTVAHLRRNVAPFPNIEVLHGAVSDRAGHLRFHASAYAAGSHIVSAGHLMQDSETIDVPSFALDDFAAGRNLRPSLIKIDVEGHEPEVLAGAAELIASARPVIAMEFNSWTLNAYGGHNLATFAQALWTAFDVEDYPRALDFLHQNLVVQGCVTDIVMRLKPGATVPSLVEMSVSPLALELARGTR